MTQTVQSAQTSPWRADHVAAIDALPQAQKARLTIPAIDPASLPAALPGIDLWDLWPLQNADGSTALFDGWSVWFVLSAPALPDPEERHHIARIRLMTHRDGTWQDCGHALPDGLNPGSREWAGSALWHPESGQVTLFYTVAGWPGEARPSFAQRLFQTTGALSCDNGHAAIADWSTPRESFASDDHHYMLVDQREGKPGFIKGFRDPAHVRDPRDGATYILFTGSLKQSDEAFNACIGIARAGNEALTQWTILPPLVSADGLNNEQERPLLLPRDGRYYLFWSTQRKVFAPDGPSGPNGIYGMVADDILGPYQPLNGTGLVAANPESTPYQAYSWWIDEALTASGFADLPGVAPGGQVDDAAWRRAHFAGRPAPLFRIALDGTSAWVEQAVEQA
ncbi:glycoside hydrolase family 68 protein [Novosphingobium terrae]|uniref:glycoside hydrolase family 68 protein n=1 Tax=Novosphingobium terrae TaxID=2726189 RepID=UPI00197D436D|nr:glycoside hydrolase family 68 protein [Novosphingobium terrae]